MNTKDKKDWKEWREWRKECRKDRRRYHHGGGGVYGLGLIGAAVYFIGQAATFGAGVVGLLKAIVWPAYLVYFALELLVK